MDPGHPSPPVPDVNSVPSRSQTSSSRNGSSASQATQARDMAPQFRAAALRDLTSITVALSRLPHNVTTREIFYSFADMGIRVARIDIEGNSRDRKARVIVEPVPPNWPPWGRSSGFFALKRSNGQSPVRVRVSEDRTKSIHDTIKTPLGETVPRERAFVPRGFLLGMMAGEERMYEMLQYPYEDVRISFQFSRRFIEITLTIVLEKFGPQLFKIPIKFAHIKNLIRVNGKDGRDGSWELVVHLPSPPEFFKKATGARAVEQTHDDELSFWQERDLWHRQIQISHQPRLAEKRPAQLENDLRNLDIGRWTTYYFLMPSDSLPIWDLIEPRLGDYHINVSHSNTFDLVSPRHPSAWSLLAVDDIKPSSTSKSKPATSNADLLGSTHGIHLPFEVRYQLEACISQGFFGEHSIDAPFLQRLASSGAEKARMMLEGVTEGNGAVAYHRPMAIFDDSKIVNYWPSAKIPPHTALIRKVVVTPTTMYVKTPAVEVTNRVLRHYSDLQGHFIRAQFTDDITFGKIWSDQGSTRSDELYIRAHRVLRNGIVVGGRHFRILAWSNSQFREHGAFFFCPTPHVSCDDIRNWMGDLKHIRSVGKFAARMGQCFTTTRQVSGISVPQIILIPDITTDSKDGMTWTFTDGAGKISPFYAHMIAHDHNLADTPSCLQVRIAGAKGILVVWPDVPSKEVHIRPSQEKFKGPYNGIEVIKVSRYSHATLNKQVIPILNCLGVEDDVFMDLLEAELKEYDEAMGSPTKAAELLRHRVDENQITLVMAEMVKTFMETNEPFLHTVLLLWKCWALQRLKQKAAISIQKSAFLYGCVDEVGVLRGHSRETEGKAERNVNTLPQIFLQVPIDDSEAPNSTNYRVVTGVCVVGRNPSLHPGDVRVVEAVDRPELRHLRDVVVFPQKGDRDIPSMCSGGDLDGDDFFVIWDERLIPKEWNHVPMCHDEASSAPSQTGAITMKEACSFFAQYMKNDSLGLIATAHVAWADKVGPKHPNCIELAHLHSKAVDYNKSGSPAIMHKRLNPKTFPHFMERTAKTHRSTKPLGRIYDRVRTIKFDPVYDMAFDARILSRFELSVEELAKAREVKGKYDTAMRRLMGRHENPVTEFEIWSTFVLSKPRVGSDYKLQEEVGRDVAALKDRFRSICGEAVTGVERANFVVFSYASIDLEQLDRFVAAMYVVTNDEVQEALCAQAMPQDEQEQGAPMPLVSFPWLFHRELSRIATGGRPPARVSKSASDGGAGETAAATAETTEAASPVLKEPSIEDYVQTSSGQVVHRGETLNLFGGSSCNLSRGSSCRSETPPAGGEESDNDGEFEEVEMVDEADEDALDALAKKIAYVV